MARNKSHITLIFTLQLAACRFTAIHFAQFAAVFWRQFGNKTARRPLVLAMLLC